MRLRDLLPFGPAGGSAHGAPDCAAGACRISDVDRLCVTCRRSLSEIARWDEMGRGERGFVARSLAARPRRASAAWPAWAAPPEAGARR